MSSPLKVFCVLTVSLRVAFYFTKKARELIGRKVYSAWHIIKIYFQCLWYFWNIFRIYEHLSSETLRCEKPVVVNEVTLTIVILDFNVMPRAVSSFSITAAGIWGWTFDSRIRFDFVYSGRISSSCSFILIYLTFWTRFSARFVALKYMQIRFCDIPCKKFVWEWSGNSLAQV